jgi:hypothetical protein
MPEFSESGGAISEASVVDAEGKLRVTFPDDYRSFLLRVNGGRPDPALFVHRAFDDEEDGQDQKSEVEMLYTVGDQKGGFNHYDLVTMNLHFRSELDMPVNWLAIGLYDELDVLLLSVSDNDPGAVFAWSFIEGGYEEDRVDRIAGSFDNFLKMLDS